MKLVIEKDLFDQFISFFEKGKVKLQDYEEDTGNNPLHLTVKAGRHDMAQYLLSQLQGIEKEDKNFDGDTALIMAVLYSDLRMVKLLVETGDVQLNTKESEGFTPFMAACANGKLDIVEYFLKNSRCNIYSKNLQGQTAIHRAAFYGEVQVIRLLLQKTKLQLTSRDTRGNSCLHFAAMRLNMTCFRYILKKLGDQSETEMKKRNQEGLTPVQLLIKAFNMIKRDEKVVSEQEVLIYIYDKTKPPPNLYESVKEQKPNLFSKLENPKDILVRPSSKLPTQPLEEEDEGNIKNGQQLNSLDMRRTTKQNIEMGEARNEIQEFSQHQKGTEREIQDEDPKLITIVSPKMQRSSDHPEESTNMKGNVKELTINSEEKNLVNRNYFTKNLQNIASHIRKKNA